MLFKIVIPALTIVAISATIGIATKLYINKKEEENSSEAKE